MQAYDSGQLDDILSDVKRLLGDTDEPASKRVQRPQPPAPQPGEEAATRTPQQYTGEEHYEWNDPSYTGAYYEAPADTARVARSHAARAAAPSAYDQPVAPRRQAPLHAPRPEPARQHPTGRAAAKAAEKPRRGKQPAYDEEDDWEDEMPIKKKKKKKGWLVLLLLLLVAFGVYKLLAKQPINPDASMGARKTGVSTILLAGTDKDGTRTDTLMLMQLDSVKNTANLVSIPRDTLVNGAYNVPKINGVYGINGGGKDGMEMLLQRVTESIGFEPDGYLLVDLDSFVDVVNIMGGVKFNVPVDMYYEDPAQDLHISLAAGEQKLDGVQAMGLVRFRSSYAQADLQRVNVQRDFVSAAADQWMSPKAILKAPRLLAWFGKNVETNLSVSNMTWIASALMRCDGESMSAATLPGAPTTISGGSYYMLSAYDVAAAVNQYLNPYKRDITVDNLTIR